VIGSDRESHAVHVIGHCGDCCLQIYVVKRTDEGGAVELSKTSVYSCCAFVAVWSDRKQVTIHIRSSTST
jgi:hypothetical protein